MGIGHNLLAVLCRRQQVELPGELEVGEMLTGMPVVPDQPEPSWLGRWFVGTSAHALQILLSEAWSESLQVGIGSSEQMQEILARVALRAELDLPGAVVR